MKSNAGIALLVAVVAVSVGAYFLTHKTSSPTGAAPVGEPVTVTGPVGGEKIDLLNDPAVANILHDRFGLTVKADKAGSLEMTGLTGKDFAWPSSQVALEMFKEKDTTGSRNEVIFNSPVVLYSWDKVVQALQQAHLVKQIDGAYYVTDFRGLIDKIQKGAKWESLGLGDLYGAVSIHTTDPTTSNSGMMFCGLLANLLNDGKVVTDANVDHVLGPTKSFFAQLGLMERSSADLFSQFVTQGMGSNPIMVGYENQLVEFVLQHPEHAPLIKQQIRILYPRPTVWSNHPMIALTPNGERLLGALKDPEIQRIAWERHGFRSGMVGIQNDPKVLEVVGIPTRIENVMQMPRPSVMQKLLGAVGHG
ncbi:substrate-binding domain-containing protein [Fimbriimonas ginsengisoli]|uniref:Uncharacterized protein n=1 Tax=Fimbriimonas ginsengisoli Gsoil 348 TaxID=661478 RepID=A0A068NV82_FIMGI|nr:substrate-binding domain-containing protein [Fimbriimonas ginsengisoli]AIE85484.1 hypothetical protein OP10G_2116 [Fimbriimonas ginsengisoli Gsoil 348]